ncbi:sigma-70 family RNA polymerase sigma factor [Cytobacillus sp. Hm23]
MCKSNHFPEHISNNLASDHHFYSMDVKENILMAKEDSDYLGDVIIANENLIWHSVHKYIGDPDLIVRNHCIEKDDILQLGRLGFMKAVKAFDVDRGLRFSSFSVTAIVREIRCFLRDSARVFRPTRTANDIINKIKQIEQELGYTPTCESLATLLDEPVDTIAKVLQVGQAVKYLDEPIATEDGENLTLLDSIEANEKVENIAIDKVYVDKVISVVKEYLDEKEQRILDYRIDGYNKTQTAKIENISQMRVSRIMKKVAELINEEIQFNIWRE